LNDLSLKLEFENKIEGKLVIPLLEREGPRESLTKYIIMKNKIYYSDLKILNYLFFFKKDNLVIFDPQSRIDVIEDAATLINSEEELNLFCNNASTGFILANLSDQSLSKYSDVETLEGMIDFSKVGYFQRKVLLLVF